MWSHATIRRVLVKQLQVLGRHSHFCTHYHLEGFITKSLETKTEDGILEGLGESWHSPAVGLRELMKLRERGRNEWNGRGMCRKSG